MGHHCRSAPGDAAPFDHAAVGGIGEAYARALAEAGAAVACADLNAAGAEGVATAISETAGRALSVSVDITDEGSVRSMVDTVVRECGGVDILVNNAALMVELASAGTSTVEFPPELWNRAFAVNVTGAWNCVRAVVPEMLRRGERRIVNQSSIGALPAESVYGITKLAVIGLTTALARELGPRQITVNCIAPGLTRSEAGKLLTPDDSPYVEAMSARAALRVKGDPSELCGALLLLVSPAGSWITGQVIVVDGGICMHT